MTTCGNRHEPILFGSGVCPVCLEMARVNNLKIQVVVLLENSTPEFRAMFVAAQDPADNEFIHYEFDSAGKRYKLQSGKLP